MNQLFGHKESEQSLKQAYDGQKLHHALLLTGSEGIGKETLAYRLINYALAFPTGNSVQNDMSSTRDVQENGHPNVFVIKPVFDDKKQRYKRDITLDALEGLTKFLRLARPDDAPRFIVVKPADGMNPQTQNALLKMLEEPPERTHFLLLTAQSGALLPTIRSRCLILPLTPLDLQEFTNGMTALLPHVDDHKIPALFTLSEGALGQALENEQLDLPQLFGRICAAIVTWQEDKNSLPAMRLAEELTRTGNETVLDKLIDVLFYRFAHHIKNLLSATESRFIAPEEQRAVTLWQNLPVQQLLRIQERIRDKWQSADIAYLDKKIVLLQVLAALSGMDS